MDTVKHDVYRLRLMNAIGFTQADLQANREGYMSKPQRATLSSRRKDWLNGITIAVIAAAAFSTFFLTQGVLAGDWFSSERVLTIGIFCVIAGVVWFIGWLHWNRLDADLDKGTVFNIEGTVILAIHEKEKPPSISYFALIQGEYFQIDKPVYDAFISGDPYIIYYAPYTKTILSVDWLRDG
jgi:hypothetical protein